MTKHLFSPSLLIVTLFFALSALIGCDSPIKPGRGGARNNDDVTNHGDGHGSDDEDGHTPSDTTEPIEEAGSRAHCDVRQTYLCLEVSAATASGQHGAYLQEQCAILEGETKIGPCPKEDYVGTCVFNVPLPDGTTVITKARYYDIITTDDIRQGCAAGEGKYQARF